MTISSAGGYTSPNVKAAVTIPAIAIFALVAASCAPSHAGKTVGRGVLQAEGSLGGPFFDNLGVTIPMPNLPLGARYGVTDQIDVNAHLNALPLVMGGFMALDAGITWGLLRARGETGFNLATGAGFALMTDFSTAARVSPLFDMAASYQIHWLVPFVGFEMALDLWSGEVITNPYGGFEVEVGDVSFSAAMVWFHPAYDTSASTVEYVSPRDRGAVGALLGLKIRWDLEKEEGR